MCTGGRMDEHPAALTVQVAVGRDGDAEEVAQATWQLRRELLDLEVDAVEAPGAGEPPPGSRAVDVAALGALVVNLADSACDEDRYRIPSHLVRSGRSPVRGARLVVRYRPCRLMVGWRGLSSNRTASHDKEPGGRLLS